MYDYDPQEPNSWVVSSFSPPKNNVAKNHIQDKYKTGVCAMVAMYILICKTAVTVTSLNIR